MSLKTYATHFCGLGGACYGLEQAGLECKLAIDWWDVAIETRKKNLGHSGINMDIAEYVADQDHAADVLWTSPVCQTFSSCSRELARLNKDDVRNFLFLASINYLKLFKPKYFIFENVLGLLTHDANGIGNGTLANIRKAFESIGYKTEWNVLDSYNWGLPQHRNRVFIVGSRDGKKGLIPKEPKLVMSPRFGNIMECGSEEEAWGGCTYKTALNKVERTDIGIKVVEVDDVLPTITCGWGGGPTRKKVAILDETATGTSFLRNPTVREGARAQGFPDSWEFPASTTDAWTLIGNAVSSPVAKAMAEHLQLVEDGANPPHKTKYPHRKVPKYLLDAGADMPPQIAFETA